MRVALLVSGLSVLTLGCPDEAPPTPPPQLLKEFVGKPRVRENAPAPAPAPVPDAAVESAPKPPPAPRPEGKRLFDFAAASATDAWVAGEGGRALHWDGNGWSPTQTGTAERLSGLVAFAGEAWACGTRGGPLHWAAGAWSPVTSSSPGYCFAAWGVSPGDVWFVGATLQHWDGKALSQVPWPWGDWGDVFFQLDGRAPNDVWAVGRDHSGGVVLAHFDGRGWTRHALAFRGEVASLAVLDSGEVWLSSETALLHRTAQGVWRPVASPTRRPGALGRGPGGLWLLDSHTTLFKLEGAAFVRQFDGLPSAACAVWPAAADAVWLAGEEVLRFDGKTVQPVAP